jgi:hypothetical protein
MNANEQTQSTSSQQENAEMKAAVEAALKSKHAKARSKRPQKKRSKTQDEPEASTSSAPVLQTNAATSDTDEEPELPTIKGLNDFSVASQENTTYVWATVVEHQRGSVFIAPGDLVCSSFFPQLSDLHSSLHHTTRLLLCCLPIALRSLPPLWTGNRQQSNHSNTSRYLLPNGHGYLNAGW